MKKLFGIKSYVPGIGAMVKGWDIPEEHFRNTEKLPIVDLMSLTGACPHDCAFCFTDKNKSTVSLDEHKKLIDELAEKGTYSIQFAGEGEPTFDRNFWEIITYTSNKGIIPIVHTEAGVKLTDRDYVKRLYDLGVTVYPKLNSLFNEEYQNSIVRSAVNADSYFKDRNKALDLLMEFGFNAPNPDGTTRIGLNMVMAEENKHEVEKTLRFCRENNIFIMFSFHLPVGRTEKTGNKEIAKRRKIAELIDKIDLEYGLVREKTSNNFITSTCKETFCIRGNGDVQVCPGNEYVLGNIRTSSIGDMMKKLEEKFPEHNRKQFSGDCLYRPKL